jgi:precorrin-2 dehydrogenase/sirohydrochlorin ferrochelatase
VSALPLVVEGSAVSALVVGGGRVAARKARMLAASGAAVRVVATSVGRELREAAATLPIALDERPYRSGDVGDATIVVAATSSREANAAVAAEARALGRLVNVADAPAEGNFATAAVHRAGDLVISVTAGGVPGAAVRIRDAIAERFDSRYAAAVAALGRLRRRVLDERGAAAWGAEADALVGADFCAAVESGAFERRVAAWR